MDELKHMAEVARRLRDQGATADVVSRETILGDKELRILTRTGGDVVLRFGLKNEIVDLKIEFAERSADEMLASDLFEWLGRQLRQYDSMIQISHCECDGLSGFDVRLATSRYGILEGDDDRSLEQALRRCYDQWKLMTDREKEEAGLPIRIRKER